MNYRGYQIIPFNNDDDEVGIYFNGEFIDSADKTRVAQSIVDSYLDGGN